jgi:hypothetical protein
MLCNQYISKTSMLGVNRLILLSVLLMSAISLSTYAVDIRGRVQIQTNYNPGWAPRPYANVDLYTFTPSNQPVYITSYTTGPDGMYFFYQLRPGPYRVVVNNGQYLDFGLGNTRTFDVNPIWVYN